ncbi:MAG: 3'(2'),5'-bisphosphate nucleotidase CysQ [Proteobacteria bacterium]|jgi:3'(2'), 5'-bisphosphate nucleotidase|nr:3'(2'),5'-bisphosphate nucleotidase CysQ [Pseudomonadota bacterium]MDA1238739.1 3'(2'),5'-bisphosphate nucleotidase CysQ [Pseudomonadota bacterium]
MEVVNRSEMIKVFRRLCLEAGEIIMKIYNSDDFDVRLKSDLSPVTVADEAADIHISRGLRQSFPKINLVTEEQVDTHLEVSENFIIVDPLDGTKEFVNRLGDFTVNIAYIEEGKPVLGVVYAPAKRRLFYTEVDGTAVEEFLPHNIESPGFKKRLSVREPNNKELIVVASKSHRDKDTDDYISWYSVASLESAGSSLKFCLIAAGEADFYPRLGRTMEWDTAAGHAVLLGAGGNVVCFETHKALTYGKVGYENQYFIAYAPGIDLKVPQ